MDEGRVEISGLVGNLLIPKGAHGIVVFAHGSGSSRHSPRNQFVAAYLRKGGLATLLIDLLTPAEEDAHRFDIPLLAKRVAGLIDGLKSYDLKVGLFGASTGAAAALAAAADHPSRVAAVVSRGGRADMAGEALDRVKAPTLLIVGGDDLAVIELNQEAFSRLKCPKGLAIVPGATHLFEESGTLEEVARLAEGWFRKYL